MAKLQIHRISIDFTSREDAINYFNEVIKDNHGGNIALFKQGPIHTIGKKIHKYIVRNNRPIQGLEKIS